MKRAPKNAAAILESTFKAYHIAKKCEEYAAFPFWAEAVGADLAAVTRPEKILKRRVLVVRVLDAVWSQELSLRKKEILDRIEALGIGPLLEDIKFVTGNPKSVGGAA